jgi:S-adenosylmethionine/arginine decarboxylase-like enzyme
MVTDYPRGKILVVIGFGRVSEIDQNDHVVAFMHELTRVAGMTLFDGPHVRRVEDSDGNGGLSAEAMWKESGVMFHGWPERGGYFRVVIDSCKDFDPYEIVGLCRTWFAASRVQGTDVSHALGFNELQKRAEVCCGSCSKTL